MVDKEQLLTPGELINLLDRNTKEPDGKVITRKTELINKNIMKDTLSDVVEHSNGKRYVKRTQLIKKTELVETYYELNGPIQ